jgi:hypothetical protein
MLRSNQLSYVAEWRALFSCRLGLSTPFGGQIDSLSSA